MMNFLLKYICKPTNYLKLKHLNRYMILEVFLMLNYKTNINLNKQALFILNSTNSINLPPFDGV